MARRSSAADGYVGKFGAQRALASWCMKEFNQHDKCPYPGCTCECHESKEENNAG